MTENKNAIDYYQREQQNKRIKLYCIEEIPRIVKERPREDIRRFEIPLGFIDAARESCDISLEITNPQGVCSVTIDHDLGQRRLMGSFMPAELTQADITRAREGPIHIRRSPPPKYYPELKGVTLYHDPGISR